MPDLISARTIVGLTGLEESAMPNTFTLHRMTRQDDGAGGWVDVPQNVSVKGWFRASNGQEDVTADQLREFGRHLIGVPKTTNVKGIDRITNTTTGKAFRIIYVFPLDEHSTSLRLGVEDA